MKGQYFGWLKDALNKKLSGGNSTTVGNSTVEKKPSSVNLSAPQLPQLALPKQPLEARLRKVGEAWEIRIEKGFVEELVIDGESATIYHEISGTETWKSIAVGQSVIVTCVTDLKGKLTGTPALSVVSDAGLTGAHFKPQVFAYSGNAGSHVRRLYKLTLDSGKPKLIRYHGEQKVEHYSERVGMLNVRSSDEGAFYEIGKTYVSSDDKVHYRTFVQLAGEGQTVIKADAEGEATSDSIKVKRIKDLGEYRQVHVTDAGNAVLVRGNGVDVEIPTSHKISMTVKDGLVVAAAGEDDEDAAGWWGTILHQFFTDITDSTPYAQLQLNYENGILVSVAKSGPTEPLTDVPGTEGTPGSATHTTHAVN